MLTASRAVSRAKRTGRPLPDLPELDRLHNGYYHIHFRGSETTMIVGQPGSLKSALALWMAAQWAKHGLTGLYVSADMAQHTAVSRLAAAITGHPIDSVYQSYKAGAEDYYAEALEPIKLRFMFESNPAIADIWSEVEAWVEVWDEYPDFIVIDNLLDVFATSGDSEFSGYKSILLDVKVMARTTGAAVFILHHASENQSDANKPGAMKSVMGKVSQTPENIISVAIGDDPTDFQLAVVKQRSGPSDKSAGQVEHLRVDPTKNRFERYIDIKAPPTITYQRDDEDE